MLVLDGNYFLLCSTFDLKEQLFDFITPELLNYFSLFLDSRWKRFLKNSELIVVVFCWSAENRRALA